MDLQPQVSFIPKRPLTASPVAGGHGSSSILWIVSLFMFVVSLVAAAGVFGYTLYLQHQITTAQNSLSAARAAYDPSSIEDLIRLNTRIEQAKRLITKHLAPSAIFSFLEQNTLATARFTQMGYSVNADGSITLNLTGNAVDFASVALQSDQFGAATHVLKNVVFSDLSIDPTSGIVKFQVSANLNPDMLIYTASSVPSSVGMPATGASTSSSPVLPATVSAPASASTPVATTTRHTSVPAPIPPQ